MKKILCFGDSLTYGYYHGGKSHPYALKLRESLMNTTKTDWVIEHRGIPGEVTEDMCDRLINIITDKNKDKYDYVILLGGTNDIGMQIPTKTIINNLQKMYDKISSTPASSELQTGTSLIAVTIPVAKFDSGFQTAKALVDNRNVVNDFIRSYVKERKSNASLFDLNVLIPYSDDDGLWDDGLHFSPKGYDRIGTALATLVKRSEKNQK